MIWWELESKVNIMAHFLSSSLLLSRLYLLLRLPISVSWLSGSGVKWPEIISREAELLGLLGLLVLRGGSEENSGRLTTPAISHSGHQLSTIWSFVLHVVQWDIASTGPDISLVSLVVHSVGIITHYGEPSSGSVLPRALVSSGESEVPHDGITLSQLPPLLSQLSEHRHNPDLVGDRPWLDHIIAVTCLHLYCGWGLVA